MGLRILFVGNNWDELDELQRATRHRREIWAMSFACGALDANRHLTSAPESPDVIVADQAQTGKDGIDLLQAMAERTPDALCVLLTDNNAVSLVSRSIPWVHGATLKPFDVDSFSTLIETLRKNPGHAHSAVVRALTESIETLPSLPATYQQLADITARRDFALREVSDVIQDDVGVTVETIRTVNSSFFGLRGEITSVEQAVNLLGLDLVRGLVLANTLFDLTEDGCAVDLETLSEYSRNVAAVARVVAEIDGAGKGDQALSFLAGMVHAVGLLLVGNSDFPIPPGMTLVDAPELAVDVALFGVDRYALGAYLLRMWGFEAPIVEAVAALSEPDMVHNAIADSLAIAVQLLGLEGFPVRPFVEGDPDVRAKVAAIREQWVDPIAA